MRTKRAQVQKKKKSAHRYAHRAAHRFGRWRYSTSRRRSIRLNKPRPNLSVTLDAKRSPVDSVVLFSPIDTTVHKRCRANDGVRLAKATTTFGAHNGLCRERHCAASPFFFFGKTTLAVLLAQNHSLFVGRARKKKKKRRGLFHIHFFASLSPSAGESVWYRTFLLGWPANDGRCLGRFGDKSRSL